jgi:hypothetical protein
LFKAGKEQLLGMKSKLDRGHKPEGIDLWRL